MRVVLALVAAYLLGSVPVAVLVGRAAGVDPRRVGDRNPGYWNVKEQLGRRRALPVFVGDTLKGTLAGLVGVALSDGRWPVGYLAVAAAMIGHAWPVFAGFRGGRSILAFAGGMAAVAPLAFAVGVAACVVVSVATRNFAYGARVGVFGAPVAQLVVGGPARAAATFALLFIIGLRFAAAYAASRN